MSAVIYRPDYAKFTLEMESDLFQTMYRGFCRAAQDSKFEGDFLKDHKVTCMPPRNGGKPRYVVEVWGEQTGLVRKLHHGWMAWLRRFDVRGIIWDADVKNVQALGQALQLGGTAYNVETFNSKPASKRLGRDRGGVGFRIGSRKSDLCAVCYKRGGDPVALEFRFQGPTLRHLCQPILEQADAFKGTVDPWEALIGGCRTAGDARMVKAFEGAGIGSYWPTTEEIKRDFEPSQLNFAKLADAAGIDMDEYMEWSNSIEVSE